MMKNESSSNNEDYLMPDCGEYICPIFPITTLIIMTPIILIIMVVGIIGNTITILIIRRYKDMRTTTNFYLSSMAVSDLVILLGLPFDLYRLWRHKPWIFGGFLCKFLSFITEGCTYATILHITALSIERYLAICFPLKTKVFITKTRVKFVIVFLWGLALLSASPFYFLVAIEQINNSDTRQACGFTHYSRTFGLLNMMFYVTTAYFFFPMFCLSILYGFIGRKLRKNKNKVRVPNANNREKSHKQTVRILVVVVLAFIICWLPFHIGRIIFVNSVNPQMRKFTQYFNIVAMQLFYLSASINPILYNLICKKYRTAAYKLLKPNVSEEKVYNIVKDDTVANTEISACMQNDYIIHN